MLAEELRQNRFVVSFNNPFSELAKFLQTSGAVLLYKLSLMLFHSILEIYPRSKYSAVFPLSLSSGAWCVTQYNSIVSTYNQINIFVHYLVPFFINFISTFILILLISRHRATATSHGDNQLSSQLTVFKAQLNKHKELFIGPLFIVLSGSPQFIISFSLACTELSIAWQRYTLTVAYFLSFLPQVLSYYLFIAPSTFYKDEFFLTSIGKKFKIKQQPA
jgi:hypothetical protein